VDVLARHYVSQFVGNDPALLEQAMKEMEAGTLVVELKTDPSQPSVEFNELVVDAAPAVEVVEQDDEPLWVDPLAPGRKKEHWEP
jgi:hypothetical protein